MNEFLKSYSLVKIRIKLIYLYILNVTDFVFTLLLIRTGEFREFNIFMIKILENPITGVYAKIVFPMFLLFLLNIRIQNANKKQLKISSYLLNCILFIYVLINVSHITWIVFYFFVMEPFMLGIIAIYPSKIVGLIFLIISV